MKSRSLKDDRRIVRVSVVALLTWLVSDSWALILATVVVIGGFVFSYALTRVSVRLRPTADEGALSLVFFAIYLIAVGIFADWNSNAFADHWWQDGELLIAAGLVGLLLGPLLWSALRRSSIKRR